VSTAYQKILKGGEKFKEISVYEKINIKIDIKQGRKKMSAFSQFRTRFRSNYF